MFKTNVVPLFPAQILYKKEMKRKIFLQTKQAWPLNWLNLKSWVISDMSKLIYKYIQGGSLLT